MYRSRSDVPAVFHSNNSGAMPAGWKQINPFTMSGAELRWQPAADICESEAEYRVEVPLPGVAKRDIKISLDHGNLKIRGERRSIKSSADEYIHQSESCLGRYSRAFALPADVDKERLKATYRDGILTIHLPKVKRMKHEPKRVAIE